MHVHTANNRTQVQAPGTVVWNDASTGDVEVRAPGFGLTCVTIKDGKMAGEQHCHIQTAWWDSDSATATPAAVPTPAAADEAIPTTTTTTTPSRTPTFSFLRGNNNRALDVVVGPNGEQTRVEGPLTDVVVDDCQETEKGRNCTYVDGRWTHVATTEEGATHVTAPGVEVRTAPNEGGDVSVDAWGFHVKCRKDVATNRTKCHTTSDWFGDGGGGRGGRGEATPLPAVDEPVPRVGGGGGGGGDDVPDPVMHLHPHPPPPSTRGTGSSTAGSGVTSPPHPPQVEAPATEDVVAAGSSTSSTSTSTSTSSTAYLNNNNRGPSPGYAPAVDPLPLPPMTTMTTSPTDLVDPMFSASTTTTTANTPPADLVDPMFSVPATRPGATTPPADLVDPTFSVPTTTTANTPPADLVDPMFSVPTPTTASTPPADLVDPMFSVPSTRPGATTGWEATTPIPDTLMPITAIESADPTVAEMGQEAAMEELDAPIFGEPRKELLQERNKGIEVDTSSSSSVAVGTGGIFEPFAGSSTAASSSSSSSSTSSSAVAKPSVPDPRDPAWLSNQKNCTRAIKGEGKDCWIEGRWVHVRTGVANEGAPPAAAAAAAAAGTTTTTEVTAPGVVMQSDNSTGIVEVRAPGVRVSCRRDAVTGEDKCTTITAWTNAKEGEEEEEIEEGGK